MISTLIPPSRPGRSPISPRIRVRIRPQFSGHRYGSVAGGAQQQTRLDDAGAGEEALAQEALVSLGHTLAPQIGDQDREEHPTEAVQRTELLHPPDYECRDRRDQLQDPDDQEGRLRLPKFRELQDRHLLPLRRATTVSSYPRKTRINHYSYLRGVYQRNSTQGAKRTLAGPFHSSRMQAYLLPPLRPGSPGVPRCSSFEREGLPWFELPGSQPSGPLPTPWLHFLCSLSCPWCFLPLQDGESDSASQPMTLAPVIVTATFAKARPARVPPVKVMDPPMASPARMLPLNAEVVIVAAVLGAQNTLHGCPPPSMTTAKSVPVSAP